ncbi:MAG: enoyl-CoA hydratase-related protein, partial [bacterium]
NFQELNALSLPSIAVIDGPAIGGGFELALACDLRLASSEVFVQLPETGLGLIPGAGGTQRLPRIVGESTAKEWIFTGKKVKADEAQARGAINKIHEDVNQLREDWIEKLLDQSSPAVSLAKQSINEGLEVSLEEGLQIEQDRYRQTFEYEDRYQAQDDF